MFYAEDGSREGCNTYHSFIASAPTKKEAILKVRLTNRTLAEIADEDADEDADATNEGTDYERGDGGLTAVQHDIIR